MKLFRRLAFVIALIAAVVCILLLLNFTAPNPTGRRYSSASPLTSGGAQAIGLSAEQILSQDLRTPRNDDPDQRQCFCNSPNRTPGVGECRVCIAFSQSISTYRRPDFVGANFIAESKNRRNLLYSHSDQVDQIGDYVVAARALGKPLWLYTRVNTLLDPEFYRMVESTGGSVIAYFTVPGYVDPVDQIASKVLIAALVVLAIVGIWELSAAKLNGTRRPAKDPAIHVKGKTDSAEDFLKTAKDRAQRKIDIEDSRNHED
jgi:hypothetical protein